MQVWWYTVRSELERHGRDQLKLFVGFQLRQASRELESVMPYAGLRGCQRDTVNTYTHDFVGWGR